MWDDIFAFAFPNDNNSEFDSENDEYFLGPIVTFKNDDNKQEIIDGQQRLTTLMLLLRAFYSYFGNMKDENSKKTAEAIGKFIWKTDEFGTANKNKLTYAYKAFIFEYYKQRTAFDIFKKSFKENPPAFFYKKVWLFIE